MKLELSKSLKKLGKWENLMLDSIEGTCAFSPAQVRKRMDAVQESVGELTKKLDALQSEADQTESLAEDLKEQHQRLLSWANVFDSASVEEKKMICYYMIKAVTLSRDYQMQVEFNISEAQYLSGMEMG